VDPLALAIKLIVLNYFSLRQAIVQNECKQLSKRFTIHAYLSVYNITYSISCQIFLKYLAYLFVHFLLSYILVVCLSVSLTIINISLIVNIHEYIYIMLI